MPPLTRALLERSPEETARRLSLALLEAANEAFGRTRDPDDEDALHDFRVALRRLRSVLRAYRPYLKGSSPKKVRVRLRKLASSTNAARDVEVQLAWLERASGAFGELERDGAARLEERLRAKRETESASRQTREALASSFAPLRRRAANALSRMRLRLDATETNFVSTTAELVEVHARSLERRLSAVRSAADFDALHRARIEGKRLRYLLEPLQREIPGVRPIVQTSKSLQDLLGQLQDARVLIEEISSSIEQAALEQARRLRDLAFHRKASPEASLPDPTAGHPGLLALLELQRERVDASYAELEKSWLGGAGDSFLGDVARLARVLRFWPREPPRRVFLLDRLPESLRGRRGRLVREGWLPGRDVRERLCSVREGHRVRYSRTVAAVSDSERPPIAETLSRRSFDALWALTEGRRLERVRYELEDGGLVWAIDEVRGRELFIAEVSEVDELRLPDWLEPLVRREITDAPEYEPERLAGSRSSPLNRESRRARSAPGTRGDPKDGGP